MLAEGTETPEVCKALEVSEATYHRWRAQYGGMKADDVKRLKEARAGERQLKRLVADKELENLALKELAKGNSEPVAPAPRVLALPQDRLGVSERRACQFAGQHTRFST